tara:strand:+ start:346 stop:753 length:408 start_codon:yes stop_codon:yes gene_type:complete
MVERTAAPETTFAPIIELEDGKSIIAKVMDIRETEGDFKGYLVDLVTTGLVEFSINGHTLLVNKLNTWWMGEPFWVEIHRDGEVPSKKGNPAKQYHVSRLRCTDEELAADKAEHKGLAATEKYVKAKIAELPPRQ